MSIPLAPRSHLAFTQRDHSIVYVLAVRLEESQAIAAGGDVKASEAGFVKASEAGFIEASEAGFVKASEAGFIKANEARAVRKASPSMIASHQGPVSFGNGFAHVLDASLAHAKRFGKSKAMLLIPAFNEWTEQVKVELEAAVEASILLTSNNHLCLIIRRRRRIDSKLRLP